MFVELRKVLFSFYMMLSLWILSFCSVSSQSADQQTTGLNQQAAKQAAAIRRQQTQTQREQAESPVEEKLLPALKARSREQNNSCIDVTNIAVSGVEILELDVIDVIVAPFEDQCLGLAEINSALEAVTFAYIDAGYVTSRAFLPEQDISDGGLDVVVVEGVLESILMNGDPDALPGQRSTAFPSMTGRPLNLRDIEQGLEQIARLQSVDATMEIEAGSVNGASLLAVKYQQTRPWHDSISLNNLGSVITGEYQRRLSLGFDDLFGVNDSISLSYQRSLSESPFDLSNHLPIGKIWTARFEIPFGYWTFSVDGNANYYISKIEGALGSIETSGDSKTVNLTTARLLHRDQNSKTTFSGTLTWKDTNSFILGSRIDVSSRSLAVASINLDHSRQLWGGRATPSIGYSQGFDIWGAFDDSTAPAKSPKGQFKKLDFSLGYARSFELADHSFMLDTRLSGQWSNDLLFGSEQLSLGGHSSVRGLKSAALFGNQAFLWRNELSAKLPQAQNQSFTTVIGRFEPFIALDIGHIWNQEKFHIAGGALTGAAIGL